MRKYIRISAFLYVVFIELFKPEGFLFKVLAILYCAFFTYDIIVGLKKRN